MDHYEFCMELIKDAGALLLEMRERNFDVDTKGFDVRDIVTTVDKALNDLMIGKIRSRFPEHAIYSEEGGGNASSSEYVWVIDPIDGTANFSRGIPHYSIVVGLLKKGEPALGAVHNPVTRELYSFKKGRGVWLNDRPICVSSISELEGSSIFFHAGRKLEVRDWGGESYRRLLGSVKKTSNFSGSALDICFVAAGRIEGVVYGTLTTKDIATAIGILIEAGGVVCDASGAPITFSTEPQKVYVANSQKLCADLIELLETP